jgi:endonuclease YncB( thermonuclease family)
MILRSAYLPSGPAGLALIGMVFIGGLLAAAAAGPVIAARDADPDRTVREAPPPAQAPLSAMYYPAEVLRVIDGDTFEARVRIWPGQDVTTRVRLRGIDAPEMRARCLDEERGALAARDALAAILAQGGVGVSKVGPDKYGGRIVAAASTRKTADVSGALLAAGLARPYDGGRREGWCGESARASR